MEGLTCLLLYWGNQPSWHERGQPLPSLLWAAICLFRSLPPYHDCGFVTISRSLTPSSVMVLCPLISFPQPSNMKKYHQFWQISHLRAYKTISLNLHSLFISAAFTWWTLTFSPSPWTTQHAPQRFLWALPLLLAPWFNSPDPTSSSPFSGLLQTCLFAAAAAKSLQSDSVWPHRWQPTRLCRPRDSPGKNTGVGCHFLLQCMKVKSEREVAQSCPTLSDPTDCSLPGSSVHGMEWVAVAYSALLSTSS